MHRSSAPPRAKSAKKSPKTPKHSTKRHISTNTSAKLVKTKKRLLSEIPAAPEIQEVGIHRTKTSFGISTRAVSFTHPLPAFDTVEHSLLHQPKLLDGSQMFAIVDVNGAQHKVTKDDQIMVNRLKDVEVGERLAFEHVLLLGGRDFSVLGKPWVPNTQVVAVVEEHTLLAPQLTWKYKRRTGYRRVSRSRDHVTVLRIEDIVVEEDNQFIPDVSSLDHVKLNSLRPTQQQQQQQVEAV